MRNWGKPLILKAANPNFAGPRLDLRLAWYDEIIAHPRTAGADFKVAWAVAWAIDPGEGTTCISHREIGAQTCLLRGTVGDVITRLRRLGFLDVQTRAGPEFRNIYRLRRPADLQGAPEVSR
jgi:hypothetical protein